MSAPGYFLIRRPELQQPPRWNWESKLKKKRRSKVVVWLRVQHTTPTYNNNRRGIEKENENATGQTVSTGACCAAEAGIPGRWTERKGETKRTDESAEQKREVKNTAEINGQVTASSVVYRGEHYKKQKKISFFSSLLLHFIWFFLF